MIYATEETEKIKNEVPGLFLEIFDDFYDDIDAVHKFALECDYERPIVGVYPGTHSLQQHPDTKRVFDFLAERLPIDGETSWADLQTTYKFWGRRSVGVFGLLVDGQNDGVHFHTRAGLWAGVCYLSDARPGEKDGLLLYQHRETGLYAARGTTLEERESYRADGVDRVKWNEIAVIPSRRNRMVLFDGRYFHAASNGYGHGPHNGRLVQLLGIDFQER